MSAIGGSHNVPRKPKDSIPATAGKCSPAAYTGGHVALVARVCRRLSGGSAVGGGNAVVTGHAPSVIEVQVARTRPNPVRFCTFAEAMRVRSNKRGDRSNDNVTIACPHT